MSEIASQCPAPRGYSPAAAGVADRGADRPGRRGVAFLSAAVRWLGDQWRRRAVIGELNRLNEHHLRDIGIERGEIDAVADTIVRRSRARRG